MATADSGASRQFASFPCHTDIFAAPYTWTQTLNDLTVRIALPRTCKARELSVVLNKADIDVQIKGNAEFRVEVS